MLRKNVAVLPCCRTTRRPTQPQNPPSIHRKLVGPEHGPEVVQQLESELEERVMVAVEEEEEVVEAEVAMAAPRSRTGSPLPPALQEWWSEKRKRMRS